MTAMSPALVPPPVSPPETLVPAEGLQVILEGGLQAPGGEHDDALLAPNIDGEPVAEQERDVEEAVDDVQPAKTTRIPWKPSAEEIEEHRVSHHPFKDWCEFCVRGKAQGDRFCIAPCRKQSLYDNPDQTAPLPHGGPRRLRAEGPSQSLDTGRKVL